MGFLCRFMSVHRVHCQEHCAVSFLERPQQSDLANTSLGGFSMIDSAKRVPELFCPGIVSCADIIALAARDAVEMHTVGPDVQIATGRRDGIVSSASNVRPNIADTAFSVDVMTKLFSSKGLSVNDPVTLSVPSEITEIDPSLDKSYAEELIRQCRAGADQGLFQSDSALLDDDRTKNIVQEFAKNQDSFFMSWACSFRKLQFK